MEVYLHIPFCRRKCAYCDFASCAGRVEWMEAYCDAVKKEIRKQARICEGMPVTSVYIGGGTPSVLPANLMGELLHHLFDSYALQPGAEVTCEANPGTLTKEFLQVLRHHGVNRLSLGVQAYQAHLLKLLGRIHRWGNVEESVRMTREAGFTNLNLDLMFGLPGQTLEEWRETVQEALKLLPEHLSMYGLILEKGTPLHDMVTEGTYSLPAEEIERIMYDDACKAAKQAGFEQYEISNFALPGQECRHNLGYWQGAYYLGLGSAAHSCMPCDKQKAAYVRFGNTPDLEAYIQAMNDGSEAAYEYEYVTNMEAEFETLMLGLRVMKGVSQEDFLNRHGRELEAAFGPRIKVLIQKGLLEYRDNHLRLTRRGMDVQNAVLVELMD